MSDSDLSQMSFPELRKHAKSLGLTSIPKYKRADLEELIASNAKSSAEPAPSPQTAEPAPQAPPPQAPPPLAAEPAQAAAPPARPDVSVVSESYKPSYDSGLDSGQIQEGVLEVLPDGYGFLRQENYLPGPGDIYISPSQIRRLNLRTGDMVCGNLRVPRPTDKFCALLYVKSVNGDSPESVINRPLFEDLTPIYPNRPIRLASKPHRLTPRIIDLLAPIGFGQRGMIVAPPKAGKTVLLKQIANAALSNYPDLHLIVLLIDERPEEVTDMRRSISGKNVDIVYSTFDEQPEHHKRVAEIVLERAKRLVEQGKDIVILFDSITRLSRAYNMLIPSTGRTLSGGLDTGALYMPKKFFGAARNIEQGGSLTIIASALVDTGSKMDDVIFEEFKGTGNMELILDRRLSEKRLYPAIDLIRSGTRHDELLLSKNNLDALVTLKKICQNTPAVEFTEKIHEMLSKTKTNEEFCEHILRIDI